MGPELITNGGFDGNANGWTLQSGWTYGSNHLIGTAAYNDRAYQTIDPVPDGAYLLTLDVTVASGSFVAFLDNAFPFGSGTTVQLGNPITATGSYSVSVGVNAFGADAFRYFSFFANAAFTGTIDNVSLRQIVGDTPLYTPSLISSIARVQQGNSAPAFIMGGLNKSSTYALFKKSSEYAFNPWRSEVFHVGHPFVVREIKIPLTAVPSGTTEIIPVLYFDNGQIASVGTSINATNYVDPVTKVVALTADNFPDGARGTNNMYLELQFTGSQLIGVKPGPDFTITIETEDI